MKPAPIDWLIKTEWTPGSIPHGPVSYDDDYTHVQYSKCGPLQQEPVGPIQLSSQTLFV